MNHGYGYDPTGGITLIISKDTKGSLSNIRMSRFQHCISVLKKYNRN